MIFVTLSLWRRLLLLRRRRRRGTNGALVPMPMINPWRDDGGGGGAGVGRRLRSNDEGAPLHDLLTAFQEVLNKK
jgi:hypothetical protein